MENDPKQNLADSFEHRPNEPATRKDVRALATLVDSRFAEVNLQFERIDMRFAKVDLQFESIDTIVTNQLTNIASDHYDPNSNPSGCKKFLWKRLNQVKIIDECYNIF